MWSWLGFLDVEAILEAPLTLASAIVAKAAPRTFNFAQYPKKNPILMYTDGTMDNLILQIEISELLRRNEVESRLCKQENPKAEKDKLQKR
jgi:hypothetical protein